MFGPKATSRASQPSRSADGGVRFGEHLFSALGGQKSAMGIGVCVDKVVFDRLDDAVRDLRAAGAVQKDRRAAVDLEIKRRELGAYPS